MNLREEDELAANTSCAEPNDPLNAPGMTWEIFARPGFLRTMTELVAADPPVSSQSTFLSPEWVLDLPAAASSPTIRIDFRDIADPLAAELKVAILVAALHPLSRRVTIQTAGMEGAYLAMFGRWMTHSRLGTLTDLGAGFGELFMAALAEFVAELHGGTLDVGAGDWDPRASNAGGQRLSLLGRGGRVSRGGAQLVARVLIHLHDAGQVIEKLTGARVRGAPFEEATPARVAALYPVMAARTTSRLPDAVLRRLLIGARETLGAPAEDVCRLLAAFVDKCGAGLSPNEAARQLLDFDFTETRPGHGPWFVGLGAPGKDPARALRSLVQRVLCAAILIVLLGTGARPGEVFGLPGGRRPRQDGRATVADDWVPRCITEELSKSGFSTAMLLHGHVYKRRERPWPVNWLVGLRQAGEADPWVLRALRTIERLSEMLRPFAPEHACDTLVLDFAGREQDRLVVDMVGSGKLGHAMRAQIPRFADLSSLDVNGEDGGALIPYRDSAGGCIALYQCRKTYAQNLYAISPRLLIPLSHQYHHDSPESTYKSYVTNDSAYRRQLEAGRARRTGFAVREALDGVAVERRTMGPIIDDVLKRCASPPDPGHRAELWLRRQAGHGGLFEPGRLRPVAGAANLFRSHAAVPPGGVDADELGTSGPSILRTWVTARRRADTAVAAGTPDAGRADRDAAIAAARRLARLGYEVPGGGRKDG